MNDKAVTVFAIIFGTIFSIVACGIIWFISDTYLKHYRARNWVAVDAKILDFGVESSRSGSGSKSTVHRKLKVSYEYSFNGVQYSGDRADFGRGADNFSETRISRQMNLLQSGEVSVYVNPLNPSESVFDRSLPGPQVAFAIFFLFFPCGVGTACMLGMINFISDKIGLKFFERFMIPIFGIIHGLPVVYPILFDPGTFTLGPWVVLIFFSFILACSIWSFIRRIIDPTIGLPEWKDKISGNLNSSGPRG
ncbi:DUF3592 domain-containing protein [Desulforegula conservatrix]|uniref:DUF3592 domain-containing protein n=1 Tax=Desulforegula conservatrix TaxID=153026 RepID=UPI0004191511|nr:DUF3592 domain-containing protein [Desulforegula conservatrix]